MSSNGITVTKMSVGFRQHPAVLKLNSSLVVHSRNGDQFAIGRTESHFPPIRGQQQPIVWCDLDITALVNVEAPRLLNSELVLYAFGIAAYNLPGPDAD